ncbi:MAG TPA: sodium:proton antiporter [Opitutaceae bacterium]|nr:sodium:proton antiporter [Opitutaceae bacterium]
MSGFEIIALLLTITALLSYLNFRWLRLPTTIGVMAIALVASLALIGLREFGLHLEHEAARIVAGVRFDRTLMQGMLSILLFAGSLHIDLGQLRREIGVVLLLATAGVFLSVLLTGAGLYFLLPLLGLNLSLVSCLLFGALISPTDPIAVMGILKTFKVPASLEIQIAGESLFNDGVGVIAFILLSEVAAGAGSVSAGHIGALFLQEALGGAAFGFAAGWVFYLLLKSVDNYQVEVLLTLALVTGGYALATALGLSGPLAIVVAGLLIGNQGRSFAMSQRTREHLDLFWELLDEIFNGVLFVLVGLEVLELQFTGVWLLAGLAAIPLLLAARWLSVALPLGVLGRWRKFSQGTAAILTWGGLRGGIPVALALSLDPGPERGLILAITYVVVVFSILVQGLTVPSLVRRYYPAHTAEPG